VGMKRIKAWLERARAFVGEVNAELKKCAWPSRSELMESTVVVIVSVVLMAIFVGASDAILLGLLRMILR